MKIKLLILLCLACTMAYSQIPAKYIGTWNIVGSKNSAGLYHTFTFYENSIEYNYSTGKQNFSVTYDAATNIVSYDKKYSNSVFDSFTITDIKDKPVMQIKLDQTKQLLDNFDWSDGAFYPNLTLEKVK